MKLHFSRYSSINLSTVSIFLVLGFFISGAQAQRGRPVLNAERTTFVADNGQLLRGPYTSSEWGDPAPADQIANMKNYGFNAVHLYAECFDINYPDPGSTAPGYAVSRIDSVVAATRDAGLYLIMTIGNGANNGNYNYDYVVDFWDFYAARYANETHVLFEIQNEPVAWGPPYLTHTNPPGAMNMEIAAYNTIRSHAPHTPVLLFSYAVPWGSGGANDAMIDVHYFNQEVFGNESAVWTNEAVAIHGYSGSSLTSDFAAAMIGFGYPCFQTEFAGGIWGEEGGRFELYTASEMERHNVSWLTFQFIPPWGVSDNITVPEVYKDVVDRSGMSWTPDYGTWPQVRGPYGNGGQPRATTGLSGTLRIEAEDFDTGGQDVTYYDTTPSNQGGQYRTGEDVDIEITADSGGGYNVGSTADGEWLEYTIFVTEPGLHNLRLRVASASGGCAARIISYNQDKTGTWTIPNTGGLQTWTTLSKQAFLEYGRQKLRIEIPTGGFNLNWIELSPSTTGPVADGTYKLANQNSGLVIENSSHTVVQKTYSGANTQQWNLQHLGAGQYRIRSASDNWEWSTCVLGPLGNGYNRLTHVDSGLNYEIENASLAGGAAVVSGEYAGSANQQWGVLAPSAPAFPTGLNGQWVSSSQINLTWTASAGATSYNVKRSTTSGGPYTTIAANVGATSYSDTGVVNGQIYYYVVSANTASGESLNSGKTCVLQKLTGTIIGTSGSWGNDPTRTKEAAMDENINTFYDATTGTGHWVGLDFGSGVTCTIAEIRYVPRAGYSSRMLGGKFQGSTTADFSNGVTDLFTVTAQPSEGLYTVQALNDPTAYRYVRYLSAPDGFCNVAEVEFYNGGSQAPASPTYLIAIAGNGSVTLDWNDNTEPDLGSYNVYRGTTSPGPYIQIASAVAISDYIDNTVINGTTYYYAVTAVDSSLNESGYSNEASATPQADPVPDPWQNQDIGTPGFAGSATYTTGLFNIQGGGNDIWDYSDNFHYVYRSLSGNGEIVAYVASIENTDSWAKAGVMIRETLTGGSKHAMMVVTPGNGTSFQRRTATGGASEHTTPGDGITAPYWVKLTRAGNTFTGYKSGNGTNWVSVGSVAITMAADVYIGMPVSSHNNGVLCTAEIDNVSVSDGSDTTSPAAPAGLVATAGDGSVVLNWADNTEPDLASYNVKRSTVTGGPYTPVATGVVTSDYADNTATNGTTYFYVVTAMDTSSNESANSNEVSATPQDTTPPTPNPATFAAAPYATGPDSIAMAAITGSDTSGPVEYLFTETSGNPGGTSSAWQTSASYTDSGLNPGTSYVYTVTMRDALGNTGAASSPASAMTQSTTPTFVAAGSIASSTGTITTALPSGIVSGDILLLFVETANQAVSISNSNGGTWAAVANSPQGTGTAGSTSATRLTVFWSRYNGTQGAPTVSDSGNHQIGRMIAIRGAIAFGDPWNVTAGGIESTSDTSASVPGATTTAANTLVVVAVAGSLPDASGTSNFSAWTNANLTSLTERTDNTRNAGNGGALGIATGVKATAGAYGNTTAAHASSSAKAMISIAIRN